MANFLRGRRCYLSGPIENGSGDNWRVEPKRVLKDEFGVDVFDPHADPKQQWVPDLNEARKQRDFETMARIAQPFVRKDLCLVDRSDFLISYLPYKVATCGSHHEIINSVNAKKPTLLICPQGKEFLPLWYFGFIPHEVMFGSWGECFNYLREVDAGQHMHNNRWAFTYGLI